MPIRYQADADLNQMIVTGVLRREPNIDFQTATEAHLEGVKDPDVLALAAQQQRILVSHDRRTMPTEFAQFICNQRCAGLLIVSRRIPLEIAINDLILIWSASEPQEWLNRIAILPL
ncbi:MAG: DUF5615 family PIN-like protein [Spirulinaceae cyanobacterium]